MKIENFSNALGMIDDKYISEALRYHRRRHFLTKWSAIAACLCLAVTGGLVLLQSIRTNNAAHLGAGGSGHDGSSAFMSYAGPVFPLTALDPANDIKAEREISFDFSLYDADAQTPAAYGTIRDNSIIIRDKYILTNTTDEDITFTAVYPYAADLRTALHQTITVNGAETATALHCGMDNRNLVNLSSWEDYKALLDDGSYMSEAFSGCPELTDTVTVYELTDISDGGSEATAPTLNMTFPVDYSRTAILTYGFNGLQNDPDTGSYSRSFFIPSVEDRSYGMVRYLVVLGRDIDGYTLQGYQDGGCRRGDEIDGANASVRRYETSLGEILKVITKTHYDYCTAVNSDDGQSGYLNGEVTFDILYGEVCRYFARFTAAGPAAIEQDQLGMLEEMINETEYCSRVLYRTFDITIPSGSNVEICAEAVKNGSFDYACVNSANSGIVGYDMVTQLGSSLTFIRQSASLKNADLIEIVRQNFGFDPANHITTVDLDTAQEHYYLEVRKAAP